MALRAHFLRLAADFFDGVFTGGGRSARRITPRRPDHVSSIAQTLLSTRPEARKISRTTLSSRSVVTPDARLGHATHRPPAGVSRGLAFATAAASARFVVTNVTTTSSAPRPASR